MTSPTIYGCPLGVTAETLSGWRDDLLNEREAAQLATHITSCDACRARLAAFDRLGATLRSGSDPDLREPVWTGLRARIARGGGRSGKRGARALWGGSIATVAAALLIVLFLALFAGHGRRPGPASGTVSAQTPPTHATPTGAATITPQSTPPNGAGWSNVFSTSGFGGPILTFAPSNPQSAYICAGFPTNSTSLLASSDGGATFRSTGPLPAQGSCYPSVDPTNPRDIAASIQTSSATTDLYRTLDGGASWQRQTLGGLSVMTLGWQGSTLWATAAVEDSGGPGLTELWVSRNGGPMTEVDQNGSVPNGVSLTDLGHATLITGHDATVYIEFGQTTVQPIGETTIRSTDGGATWAQVKFMDGSQLVHLVTTTPDAKTLIGVYDSQNSQVVVSHDDGASWRKLAPAPSGVSAFGPIWATPDGSVLATSSQFGMAQNPDSNLYELAAGATSWSVALAIPQTIAIETVSWDANGRPRAAWATGSLNAGSGVFSHALG